MRNILSYGIREWIRAVPLIDAYRLVRNLTVANYFRHLPSPTKEFLIHIDSDRSHTLAVCIAFNTPWLIELMARASRINLLNTTLLIADNSNNSDARLQIEAICKEYGLQYLPLPYNPVKQGSRSHGVALNWVYYNVIVPLRPRVFAFLDHDLIPLCPVDLSDRVVHQPVYGRIISGTHGWFIWGGYCVYDFEIVSRRKLDFTPDKSRRFDTGGRNWLKLYRHLSAGDLELVEALEVAPPGQDDRETKFQIMDEFLHIVGGAGAVGTGFAGRREIGERLVDLLEEGRQIDVAMKDVGLHASLPCHKPVKLRAGRTALKSTHSGDVGDRQAMPL